MRAWWSISALCLVSACAAGEDYQTPEQPLPVSWKTLSGASENTFTLSEDTKPLPRWWEQFNDPILNQLVDRAIAGNNDLKIATTRVREARASYLGVSAALMPEASLGGQAKRGNEGMLSQNKVINLYQANFDASWEIDMFGGNRRKEEAAGTLTESAEAERENMSLSLAAEVARNYIDARNAQIQLTIVQRNSESESQLVQLIKSRRDAGLVSGVEAAQAEAAYQATVSRRPTLQTSYDAAINRLSTLIGEMPGAVDGALAEEKPLPATDTAAILATPAASIAFRPDVKSAERKLAAATALKGAAIAELFPKVTLSGLFGAQKSSLFPETTLWSAASGLTMPVFNFGRLEAGINTADARQEQALAAYRQSILLALEETENALGGYIDEQQRTASLQAAADNHRQAAELAGERYRRGIAAFTDVLIAQRDVFTAESALAESQAKAAKNTVALYKALGGATAPKAVAASTLPSPPAPAGTNDTTPGSPNPLGGPMLDSGTL